MMHNTYILYRREDHFSTTTHYDLCLCLSVCLFVFPPRLASPRPPAPHMDVDVVFARWRRPRLYTVLVLLPVTIAEGMSGLRPRVETKSKVLRSPQDVTHACPPPETLLRAREITHDMRRYTASLSHHQSPLPVTPTTATDQQPNPYSHHMPITTITTTTTTHLCI